MTADIQKYDVPVGDGNGQSDAIAIGDVDRLNTFEPAAEMVIGKMGRKGIWRWPPPS